ncbi:unnamed protein product [Fraxinus pennsylvanica]|uniref:non-specific serine/threonine protein kinase n=1 Tax=Fraxinus pennsylvanica TaxID=56036 RepID=A0AAD2A9X0_9LAMI|nr:unnamed protein product [Fraxinus pennsylvanica]
MGGMALGSVKGVEGDAKDDVSMAKRTNIEDSNERAFERKDDLVPGGPLVALGLRIGTGPGLNSYYIYSDGMAPRATEVIRTTRHAEITEDLTAIHVIYRCTHYTRFYMVVDEDEGIETFEEYKDFLLVMVDVYDLITDIPVPSKNGNIMSISAIIGIVIAVLFTLLLVLSILWWKGCFIPTDTLEQDLKGLSQHTGLFTLRQIRVATNNFDPANKIGEGGFGPVYKGLLSHGTAVAVKQLSSKSKQGNREFVNEIGMISALQHPHLVKLYGCCIEGNQLLLVYEYMENNNLARALFSQEKYQLKLDWPTRHKICIGIARGLAYLHEESRLKIVHRDIKATNAHSLKTEGKLMELVDPRLESNFNEEEVITTTKVALHCTNVVAAKRPSMSVVVSMLGGRACVAEFVSDSSVLIDKVSSSSISMDMPLTSSSKPISNLYPFTY